MVPVPEFDPNAVPIVYTLSVPQVDLILEALSSLPISRAGAFFSGVKQHADQTVASARAAHESLRKPTPPAPEQQPVTPVQEA